MSKISSFVNATHQAGTQARAYDTQTSVDNNKTAYWARENNHVETPKGELSRGASGDKLTVPLGTFEVQIKAVLKNHYRFIGQTPRRAVLANQVKLLTAHYQTLRKLQFDITDVSTFGLRHARSLLQLWQSKSCAPSTIYCRWSVLRSWTRALGKHGMLGTLSDIQPEFVRHNQSSIGIRMLTNEQVDERSDFLRGKTDMTVYFVDRLCRELRITREEALMISQDAVNAALTNDLYLLRTSLGNQGKNVPLSQHSMALMGELSQFMKSRNRRLLAWSNLDLDAALQKYSLRLAYVSRTLFPEAKRTAGDFAQHGGEV